MIFEIMKRVALFGEYVKNERGHKRYLVTGVYFRNRRNAKKFFSGVIVQHLRAQGLDQTIQPVPPPPPLT